MSSDKNSVASETAPTRIRVVDADVHHNIRDKSDLYPYLTNVERTRLEEYGMPRNTSLYQANGGWKGARADVFDAGEDVDPRSNFAMFQTKLLDACSVDVAILQVESTPSIVALADVDYSAALIRAINDWSLEHWVARDPRYRLSLTIPMHDPAMAVKEIERLGGHPAVVAAYVVCGSPRLYGKREFDPVYAACVEHGLSLSLHFSNEGFGMNPPMTSAGYPSYYAETYLVRPQFYQAHLSSFLFEAEPRGVGLCAVWFHAVETPAIGRTEPDLNQQVTHQCGRSHTTQPDPLPPPRAPMQSHSRRDDV